MGAHVSHDVSFKGSYSLPEIIF